MNQIVTPIDKAVKNHADRVGENLDSKKKTILFPDEYSGDMQYLGESASYFISRLSEKIAISGRF